MEYAVRNRYDEVLSPDIIKDITDNLKINHPALINNVVPEIISYVQLTSICKSFVRKEKSLIYLPKIIEILSDLQRDGVKRNDAEVLDIIIQRIENKNNFNTYLAKRDSLKTVTE